VADSFIIYDESEGDLTGISAASVLSLLGLDADLPTFSVPASTTISAFGATLVDDANAAAVLATLGLDADLATFSLPASTTISAFIKTLLDDADAATALSTLGVHAAVTVSAPLSVSGQALSLVNDAAATITEIDTGALANSDTVIPTSKAVTTAIAGFSSSSGYEPLVYGASVSPPDFMLAGTDILSAKI
jgi:hypothetical protein